MSAAKKSRAELELELLDIERVRIERQHEQAEAGRRAEIEAAIEAMPPPDEMLFFTHLRRGRCSRPTRPQLEIFRQGTRLLQLARQNGNATEIAFALKALRSAGFVPQLDPRDSRARAG